MSGDSVKDLGMDAVSWRIFEREGYYRLFFRCNTTFYERGSFETNWEIQGDYALSCNGKSR